MIDDIVSEGGLVDLSTGLELAECVRAGLVTQMPGERGIDVPDASGGPFGSNDPAVRLKAIERVWSNLPPIRRHLNGTWLCGHLWGPGTSLTPEQLAIGCLLKSPKWPVKAELPWWGNIAALLRDKMPPRTVWIDMGESVFTDALQAALLAEFARRQMPTPDFPTMRHLAEQAALGSVHLIETALGLAPGTCCIANVASQVVDEDKPYWMNLPESGVKRPHYWMSRNDTTPWRVQMKWLYDRLSKSKDWVLTISTLATPDVVEDALWVAGIAPTHGIALMYNATGAEGNHGLDEFTDAFKTYSPWGVN